MKKTILLLIVIFGFMSWPGFAAVGSDETLLRGLRFRRLGPDRCGSWVTCFAVPDQPLAAHLYTFYVGTRNGGSTCDQYANLPLSEFYAVAVDMEEPYNIYGGLQDHDSWKVPSNGWSGRIGL
jgi:hypothetical protein